MQSAGGGGTEERFATVNEFKKFVNFCQKVRSVLFSALFKNTYLTTLLKVVATAALLLAVSLTLAFLPLLAGLEDFFVNGLHYDKVTLFTGMVDKNTHYRILESYNGRYKDQPLSWVTIRHMVREMFSNDYWGIEGSKVEFYGSDSVCIFKYLVTKSDPQHLYSLVVLLLNFLCFVLITACYLVIQYHVLRSSRRVATKNSTMRKRELTLQTKISIIIATDFCCWIPFIVVCLLHFFEIIDASSWYPLFSIIILPFNSVINPLLYSNIVTGGIKTMIESIPMISSVRDTRDTL